MQREGKGSRHLREELPGRVSSYPEPGGCAQKAAEAVRQRKPCFWGRSLDFILSAMVSGVGVGAEGRTRLGLGNAKHGGSTV